MILGKIDTHSAGRVRFSSGDFAFKCSRFINEVVGNYFVVAYQP